MNIYSGTNDGPLAAALTNPTELARKRGRLLRSYPVRYAGRDWPDAEAVYLTLKVTTEDADKLMIEVITAKFTQHPELLSQVAALGGVAFLERCRHIVNAKTAHMRAWEGFGRNSRFIRNLIAAYEAAQR